MKRPILFAAAAALLIGCTQPTEEYVKLSDAICTFQCVDIPQTILINASGPWSVETGASWVRAEEQTDALVLSVDDNDSGTERSTEVRINSGRATAIIVISADKEGVEEIRIPISQAEAPDHHSTLTQDFDLNELGLSWARTTISPASPEDEMIIPSSTWEVAISSEGVNYNPNTGKFEGTGHQLKFTLVTDRIEQNEEQHYVIPDGEYVVGPVKPYPGNGELYYKDPFTIDLGQKTSSFFAPYKGFWYMELLADGSYGEMAPVITGTVTVTKLTAGYRFEFDLTDDVSNRLSGTYEGAIGLYVYGVSIPD